MAYSKLKQAMVDAGFEVSEGVHLTAQDQAASRDYFYISGKKMEDFVDIMGRPVDLSDESSFESTGEETGENTEQTGEPAPQGQVETSEVVGDPVVIEGLEAPKLSTEEAVALEQASQEVAEQAAQEQAVEQTAATEEVKADQAEQAAEQEPAEQAAQEQADQPAEQSTAQE